MKCLRVVRSNAVHRVNVPQVKADRDQWLKSRVRSGGHAKRETIQDQDIGMTAYFSDHHGFTAKYKSLYEDFRVTEITEDEKLVTLDNWKNTESIVEGVPFTTFTLTKRNRSTHEVLEMLAECSGIERSHFSAHGLKDRRAVTAQKVSVEGSMFSQSIADKMMRHHKWDHAVRIGDFQPSDTHCRVGELYGNRFSLCLRDLQNEENIPHAVSNIQANGYINYFGHQRFGTGSKSSHHFGRELLKVFTTS